MCLQRECSDPSPNEAIAEWMGRGQIGCPHCNRGSGPPQVEADPDKDVGGEAYNPVILSVCLAKGRVLTRRMPMSYCRPRSAASEG
jgi:hypothetical protein